MLQPSTSQGWIRSFRFIRYRDEHGLARHSLRLSNRNPIGISDEAAGVIGFASSTRPLGAVKCKPQGD